MRFHHGLLARAALAAVSTYLSLVVGQCLLPYITGTEVRLPFDTPFLRSACRMLATWATAHLLVPYHRMVLARRGAGHR